MSRRFLNLFEQNELVQQVQQCLTPDLLHPRFRDRATAHPHSMHCYHAAEALWHKLGGKESRAQKILDQLSRHSSIS